jgi:hypothetical protein
MCLIFLRKAGHNVQIISGPTDIPSATTPGAFLNFGGTNIYKAGRLSRWVDSFFVTEPFLLVTILYLLMLGTLASSILNI